MPETLFEFSRPLSSRLSDVHERVVAAIEQTDQTTALGADEDEWAQRLADRSRVEPPELDLDGAYWEDLGPMMVDCSGMAGITFTTSEWGEPVLRDGRRMVLHVPASGAVDLLRFGPEASVPRVEAQFGAGHVLQIWEWPIQKGRQALEAEAQTWLSQLREGAARVAAQVREFNDGLVAFALGVIAERREYLRKHDALLEGMSIPIAPREDAPRQIVMPPITRRSVGGSRSGTASLADAAPAVPHGPQLGALYDEILRNVRAMGK